MTRMHSTAGVKAPAVQTSRLLTPKQLPGLTGLSKSFFDKGRIYHYGPPFLRVGSGTGPGRIFYREADVLDWMTAQLCRPEVRHG